MDLSEVKGLFEFICVYCNNLSDRYCEGCGYALCDNCDMGDENDERSLCHDCKDNRNDWEYI